ncbi:MAG: D-alanyl-D-alanine carboxypeptidase [Defluviitaleaceae bacterium]|nr:D-alanyl-D-alanine carboxypeptidase [Defluviitaleaceae bacterium]
MKKTCFVILAAAILLLATAYILPYDYMDENPYIAAVPALHQPPPYEAGAVVIMCADTGMVLYGHEYHTTLYPASITKIMTALVVLDHVQDLSERIEFSYHSIFSIPRNSSHISMDVGETLTVNQALNALMIRSANEVAIALAEHVAGSEEEFVRLMNARAQSLGAVNTYFTNPTGLPGVGHVTTAYDMALIKREAVRLFPIYTNIIATPQFAIPPTERQPETRFLNTTNQMIRPGPYFDDRVIGGKTGWTHAAGNTLVTYAAHEGRRLIVTILQSNGTDPFRETTALLNFAFALEYEDRVVFNAATYTRIVPVYATVNDERTEIYRLTLQAPNDKTASLPANFDLTRLRYNLTVQENITAPIRAGDRLGTVGIYVQNVRLGEVALLAQSAVPLPAAPTNTQDNNAATASASGNSPDTNNPHAANNAPATGNTVADTPDADYPQLVLYDPYAAMHYPLAYPNLPGFTQHREQWTSLIIPLGLLVAGLSFSALVLITRRKRNRRHVYGANGLMYRYKY